MSPSHPHIRTGLHVLFTALFTLLLLAPHLQRLTQTPKDRQLDGIRITRDPRPAFTLKGWLNNTYASRMDRWLRMQTGLHAHAILLNRQIRHTLFTQIAPAPMNKTSVIVGQFPWLHENLYLHEALRRPVIPPERLERFVTTLADMQNRLQRNNKAFVVILAPQKALLYAENLPRWAQRHVRDDNADFPNYLAALKRHRVNHIDSMSLFRELKPDYPHLVPPHGAHWSYHGAWIVWQEVLKSVNTQNVIPPVEVPRTARLLTRQPSATDHELRGQLNLFRSPYSQAVPANYPVPAPLADTNAPLNVLVVGDSFGFGIIDAMARAPLCKAIHYMYYMRSVYEAIPPTFDPLQSPIYSRLRNRGFKKDYSKSDAELLKDVNLVVFVCTSFNIDKYGWDFDQMMTDLPK